MARRLGRWTKAIGGYWGFTGVNTEFWAERVWVHLQRGARCFQFGEGEAHGGI